MTKLPPAYTADTQAAFLNFDFGCENTTSFRFGICWGPPFLKFFFLQDFLACFQLSSPHAFDHLLSF